MTLKPTIDDRKDRMNKELKAMEQNHKAGVYDDCEDVYQVCRGTILGKLAEIEFDRLAELAKD